MSSRQSSRNQSLPRIRRLSRYELEQIFPSQRRSSISVPRSNTINIQVRNSTSNLTNADLTNLQHCPTPSDQRRPSINRRNSAFEQQQTPSNINSKSKKKFKISKKQSFRLWCLCLSLAVGAILLAAIITTIVLLLTKPTTTTTTTSTTQTTVTTTTSTSATTSTSTSTTSTSSTSTTSTSSTTSTTSTSSSTSSTSSTSTSTSTSTTSTSTTSTTTTTETTSTSSTSSTSSSTSTTTSTTSTATTTTTPNTQLGAFNDSNLPVDIWTFRSYSYYPPDTNLTLEFILELDNKHEWYLDDVSVKDSSSSEKLINGNFEGSSLTGWTTGACPSNPGLSNARSRSAVQSYRNPCQSQVITLRQSFSAIPGQLHNITLWFYLDQITGGAGTGFNRITINLY